MNHEQLLLKATKAEERKNRRQEKVTKRVQAEQQAKERAYQKQRENAHEFLELAEVNKELFDRSKRLIDGINSNWRDNVSKDKFWPRFEHGIVIIDRGKEAQSGIVACVEERDIGKGRRNAGIGFYLESKQSIDSKLASSEYQFLSDGSTKISKEETGYVRSYEKYDKDEFAQEGFRLTKGSGLNVVRGICRSARLSSIRSRLESYGDSLDLIEQATVNPDLNPHLAPYFQAQSEQTVA